MNWTQKVQEAPPKPTDTTYFETRTPGAYEGEIDVIGHLTWAAPASTATGFHIYLVWECYATKSGQPCVETGMHTPAADRTLAGTVSVSTRSFLVKFSTNFEGFGVMAVLVAAFNAVGESKSAIAFTRTR